MKILSTGPWQEWEKKAVRETTKNATFLEPGPEVTIEQLAAQADVLYGWPTQSLDAILGSPTLKLIQTRSTGVDRVLTPAFLRSPITLANARGVHAEPVAEHAIALMFAVAYNLRDNDERQRSHIWATHNLTRLYGKTAGILGMGTIGQGIAKRCAGLGMRVIGARRDATKSASFVEETYPLERLHEFLGASDVVLCSLPGTSATHGMLAAPEFSAMKESSIIVNVGRGTVIDQPDLIEALLSGQIGGAGLDVFSEEPLDPKSPLWDMRNVVITPHSAGYSPENDEKALGILIANLQALEKGLPLVNVVDKEAGY